MIYLDNAATTKIDSDVVDYMSDILKNVYGNPSSIHSKGREAKVIVDEARDIISNYFGIDTTELFFTSGGTESINTIFRAAKSLGIEEIICGKIEHKAVLDNVKRLESEGIKVTYLNADVNGQYQIDELEELLSKSDRKKMLAMVHVNNELGSINDIQKAAEICKQNNTVFFSDTVQSVAKMPLDFKALGVDFAISSAHKFHGPKGVGFLYINSDLKIDPLMIGGGQEQNMRGGTENIYGIAGMQKAIEIAHNNIEGFQKHNYELKAYTIKQLKSNFEDIIFNTPDINESACHILNISFPKDKHNDMMIFNLDIDGIAVSGGSACSSGSMKISHVIEEISEDDNVIPLRISFSKFNTKSDVDKLIKMLKKY